LLRRVVALSLKEMRVANPDPKTAQTLIRQALLDGEAEELIQTAVRLAKAGNVPLLKFFLGRILPRDRLIQIDLPPLKFADDVVEALGCIIANVAEGKVTPRECADLASLLNLISKAIDQADIVKRLDALEANLLKPENRL
jgi:hypothetical protein